MNKGEMKVYNALMQNEGLTFTQLKQQVNLSAPVLSEYLKRFEADGFIEKVAREYTLKKMFLPLKKLSDREQAMRFLASSAPILAMKIKQVKDETKRVMMIKEFLKLYLIHGSSVMVFSIITHCLDTWLDKPQKLDVLLPLLNEQAKNWIVPYVQKVALALALNIEDVMKNKEAVDEMFKSLITEMQKDVELEGLIKALNK